LTEPERRREQKELYEPNSVSREELEARWAREEPEVREA